MNSCQRFIPTFTGSGQEQVDCLSLWLVVECAHSWSHLDAIINAWKFLAL
jgi:hypothetical protein